MKIKVNKHKSNIHYRGSPWGSRTKQHAYCLRYDHSNHIESHLGKKQPQAKIAIAFLYGQLHFNNVTSHALFYGGHLVMRSKRCAVQNQGITLRSIGSCQNGICADHYQKTNNVGSGPLRYTIWNFPLQAGRICLTHTCSLLIRIFALLMKVNWQLSN